MRILILTMVLFLSACSGTDDTPETRDAGASAVAVATDWVDAVATIDVDRIERLIEPTGLAVVAAVENDLRSDELAGILRAGIPRELGIEYWTGFRDDFGSIRGRPFETIAVGDEVAIPGSSDYVGIRIAIEDTNGMLVLRRIDSEWKIDFAATIGPALVGPLGEYLESALTGEHATIIADSYRSAVVPALTAAAALDQDNAVLLFETEYIRQLVSP